MNCSFIGQTFDLSKFSQYRTELMGFAAVMILICHSNYIIPMPHWIVKAAAWGNLGVLIFLFLSGIGLFYSLSRFNSSLLLWYKKRYTRIFVPYLIISIPWFLIRMYKEDGLFMDFIMNVLTISFWTNHAGAWFVALLIPLYAVTPLFYKILINRYSTFYLLVIVLLLLASCFLKGEGFYGNVLFVLRRLPCFFIGMYIAKYVKNKTTIKILPFSLCVFVMMFILYCLSSRIGWMWPVPSIFIMMILCCLILERKRSKTKQIAAFMGAISLESYIMNICLLNLFMGKSDNILTGCAKYLIIVIVGTLASYVVSRLSQKIINKST